MNLNTPEFLSGANVSGALFGGNVLASHGAVLGNTYEAAINDLGVTTLRFPGGSLTEYLFDIRDPDAPTAFDPRSGSQVEMTSLSEFMSFAEVNNNAVTIVIPTQTQLSDDTDIYGDRLPQVDGAALRGFVQDVASGVYGDADVRAFEVGNEYWGSGQMNAAEYGRLAAEMSVIIDGALDEIGAQDIDVVVQKGQNYGQSQLSEDYADVPISEALAALNLQHGLSLGSEAVFSNGQVNWTHVNNEIVLSKFDTDVEREAIDGVVAHVYSGGADNPNSRTFDLRNIEESWLEEMPELDVYVTEWNQRSTAGLNAQEEYGLFQAHEMLNIFEEFARLDVAEANVWPLIQNTRNALSNGFTYDEATAPGEMFAMMAETLPGKTLLDFTPRDDRTTEQIEDDVAVHAFAGEGELAFYIVNTERDATTMTDVDMSALVRSYADVDISRLGVAEGARPGDNQSDAQVQELAGDDVIEDGFVVADLLPGEILQVVLSGVVPTAAFRPAWEAANGAADVAVVEEGAPPLSLIESEMEQSPDQEGGADPGLPSVPVEEGHEDPTDGEEPDPMGDGMDGLEWALALLPLLALLGMAG